MPSNALSARMSDPRLSTFGACCVVAAIILTALVGFAWSASETKFLNCDMECGETLYSIRAANQFAAHGIDYGLLENLRTHDAPLIYTHNVNIGALTFVALEAIGVPPADKFLLPLGIFGVGLLYVYLTARRLGGNHLAGLIILLIFASTYWGLGAFALNPLRAWHLPAFFAGVFHTIGVVRREHPAVESAGLMFAAIAAFGCGYDFWIIVGAVCGTIALAHVKNYSLRKLLFPALTIAFTFATPFVLRQVHIASVMGASYWWQDLYYSVAIKVPYADRILEIPSIAEIDAYYREHNVLRPPAQPANSAAEIFYTLHHMITRVTVPRWGWLSLLTLLAVLFPAFMGRSNRETWIAQYSGRLIIPVILGTAIGLAVLAPFSLHVYFKHEFPLFAFPLLLAKGAAIYWLLSFLIARHGALKKGIAATILGLFILDAVMVHWNNTAHGPALNLGWGKIFKQLPNEKIALTTYPLIAAANPFIGIDEQRAMKVTLEDMLDGRSDIRYWVYQPSDRFVDFDSPNPRCEWTGWLRQILNRPFKREQGKNCIYGYPIAKTARSQPSITDLVSRAKQYSVVEKSDRGIGYVILKRKDIDPTN